HSQAGCRLRIQRCLYRILPAQLEQLAKGVDERQHGVQVTAVLADQASCAEVVANDSLSSIQPCADELAGGCQQLRLAQLVERSGAEETVNTRILHTKPGLRGLAPQRPREPHR